MAIKKKDFVELEFTGKIKESGQIFDTTKDEDAKKMGAENVKPLKICIGDGMVVKGFDDALIGKEIGKPYSIEIPPSLAFGPRDSKLIKIVPISMFIEKQVNPYPGLVLNIDGILARVSSVSGGRVTTDFNLPLAGKTIIYDFKIKRIIEDKEEKLKTLAEFYLGTEDVRIEGNKADIILEKKLESKAFKEKAKDLTGFDVEFKVK
jgi:FKBP-type peptidyl-prolyl cis-trans isomerase SlyD